jgi:hypothetical protein
MNALWLVVCLLFERYYLPTYSVICYTEKQINDLNSSSSYAVVENHIYCRCSESVIFLYGPRSSDPNPNFPDPAPAPDLTHFPSCTSSIYVFAADFSVFS